MQDCARLNIRCIATQLSSRGAGLAACNSGVVIQIGDLDSWNSGRTEAWDSLEGRIVVRLKSLDVHFGCVKGSVHSAAVD